MSNEAVDWVLRALMGALTVWVFYWGRSAKQAEELLAEKFQSRDTKLDEILRRIESAGQKASDVADKVMAKINDHSERLAVVEMQIKDRRFGGEHQRRQGTDDRRE